MNVLLSSLLGFTWASLWLTADQQGDRLYQNKDYKAAADHFQDTMWKGTALFQAGEFKEAASVFSRLDSAEAHYNRGNCQVMLGSYQDAVESYQRALERKPGWKEASENRDLAAARAKLMEKKGGDMGDPGEEPDEIVFDKTKPGGKDTEVTGEKPADDASMQSLWLRKVQTRPADFLRAKFAQQHAAEKGGKP